MFNLKKIYRNWYRKTFLEPKKNEELKKLYLKVEEYLHKVYEQNFVPNMKMFNETKYYASEDFIKSFGNYFAGYDTVYHFFDLKNKLCGFAEPVRPSVLMDYMFFFKNRKIKYIIKKLEKHIITKIDGTIFEVDDDKIEYIHDNIVHWKNDAVEMFQKIEPVYSEEEKSLEWSWTDDITLNDIENKYIDFKTEEERILRYEF